MHNVLKSLYFKLVDLVFVGHIHGHGISTQLARLATERTRSTWTIQNGLACKILHRQVEHLHIFLEGSSDENNL
ncbi:hypothetical protein D3C76_1505380 [compost metagenome]